MSEIDVFIAGTVEADDVHHAARRLGEHLDIITAEGSDARTPTLGGSIVIRLTDRAFGDVDPNWQLLRAVEDALRRLEPGEVRAVVEDVLCRAEEHDPHAAEEGQ